MKKILFLVCILLLPRLSEAACSWTGNTGTVASPYAPADFNACVSDASSKTGEVTIQFPACNVTWTTQGSASLSTGFTNVTKLIVKGAGIDVTTIVLNSATAGVSAFNFGNNVNKIVDFSDMTLDGTNHSSNNAGLIAMTASAYQSAPSFRIHNVKFIVSKRGIWAFRSYGVIDHNTFTKVGSSPQMLSVFGGGTLNWDSWERPTSFGTSEAVYFEDNTVTYSTGFSVDSAIDCYAGGRFVARYNTFINTAVGWHGLDSGYYASCYQAEIYNNTITNNISTGAWNAVGNMRGGTGVIYNNLINGSASSYSVGMAVSTYRESQSYDPWRRCDGTNWKACTGAWNAGNGACTIDSQCTAGNTCTQYFCSGRTRKCSIDGDCPAGETCGHYFDLNTSGTGYPCVEQIGRGYQQALDPIYEWNNCKTALGCSNGSASDISLGGSGTTIQVGRDVINNTERPGYTAYTYPHPLIASGGPYTVTPSISFHGTPYGTITPSSAQTVTAGNTATFTVTPSEGSHIYSVGGTCGGTLSGETYTTNAINSNCTVVATFGQVITESAGAGGTLSCTSMVPNGEPGTCTAFPSGGYHTSGISGCGISWVSGNSATTSNLTADCTVTATFALNEWLVTGSGGSHGTVSPASQVVANNGSANFTIAPESGYYVSISGTCPAPSHVGNVFTFSPITQGCSFTASFLPLSVGGGGKGGVRGRNGRIKVSNGYLKAR